MFGRGRFQNGVLIDPEPQFAFDPKDEEKLKTFRGLIWQVYDSWERPLDSEFDMQADCRAAECLCTSTLSAV